MNTGPDGGEHPARLLLALDALNCDAALIDAAARLAGALGAELDVLFVEDDDLYAVADLPITLEISRNSARARELNAGTIAVALRSLSRAAEVRLRAASARGRFRSLRARRSEALCTACAEVDMLLLAPQSRTPVRLLMHAKPTPVTRVFVVCGDTPASLRALGIAARLARLDHQALSLITAGPVDEARIAVMERAGILVSRHALADTGSLAEVTAVLENRPGNTVLVAADLPLAGNREVLVETLSQLRCQSLLVN